MRRFVIVLAILAAGFTVHAQGGLSNQVLQLLSRDNNWSGQNSFSNLVVPIAAIPSTTTARIYTDLAGNLYYNGGLIAGAGGGVTPHNLLSTTHADTLAAAVVRGDVIIGNSTPAWARLAKCTSGFFIGANATDTVCSNDATQFINIQGANIVGAIAAVSGVNLTNLNASNLASGTVPNARLTGVITNAEVNAGAAIAYSKLNLAGSVILTSDVTGTLPLANGGTGLSTAANNTTPVSSGAAWVARVISDCHDGTHALAFTQATNLFSCQAITVGAGTVTSVGLSLPAIFTVSGSPVTGAGTLTAVLASQTQNLMFASPNGGAGSPTFRAFVNADLPTSGIAAGTYPKATFNAQGIATAGTATISLTADVAGTLPRANGGTGLATSANNSTMIGNGTNWIQTSLTGGPLTFVAASNTFVNTLPLGTSTTNANFAGGLTDPTTTTSGAVQNTEYTLNSLVLNANAFDANTRGVDVYAWGTTAANADTKNIKIYFGSVAVATVTGSTANAKDFFVQLHVVRTGGNAQSGVATIQVDTATSPTMAVSTTIAQTDSASITIAVKSADTAAANTSATGKGMHLVFTN